jgi:POT family proton-dependent oligopeptide transporter
MVSYEQVISLEKEKSLELFKRDPKTKDIKTEEVNGVKSMAISVILFDDIKDGNVKKQVYEALATKAQAKEKNLFGIKINSLYGFFMVFVIMAGIASVILFLLSNTLLKMMHGIK